MNIERVRGNSWGLSSMKSDQTHRRNCLRGRVFFVQTIAAACVLIVLAFGCGPRAYQRPTVDSNRVAPEFTAQTLEGGRVQLSSLRGKVVVLHIWAAWQCADELPGLDEIASRLLPHDVVVVAVSIDRDIAMLKNVARSRAAWRLALLHDPEGQVAKLYDPSAFPAAYVIDRAGRLRHAHPGLSSRDLPLIESQAAELAAK
jgi:peroxiredoxin